MAEKLTIVLVQTGNYCGRGDEYVHKLRAQIKRHITVPHDFRLVTDDASALYPGMLCKPAALPGWWEKIRLFKPGMFSTGRVMFLDLDTFIVDNIDDIASYQGNFATLRDFWRPEGLGPAVMLWHTDWAGFIWAEFEKLGKPTKHSQGDQHWLETVAGGRVLAEAERLQDLYPNAFVSYKTHCKTARPETARVVCFHGKPRPHEADGWAKEFWHVQ